MAYENKKLHKWQKWMITFWPVIFASCFVRMLFTTIGSNEARFWALMCLLSAFGPIVGLMIPLAITTWSKEWWKWINE